MDSIGPSSGDTMDTLIDGVNATEPTVGMIDAGVVDGAQEDTVERRWR
jgi:hypothetical protein